MESNRTFTINKIPEDVLRQLKTLAALSNRSPREVVITLIRERSEALNLNDLIRRLEIADEDQSPVVEVVKAAN